MRYTILDPERTRTVMKPRNYIELADALLSIGWASPNDAQWERLKSWYDGQFSPDWNELEACRESLREHMDLIKKERVSCEYWRLLYEKANKENALLTGGAAVQVTPPLT